MAKVISGGNAALQALVYGEDHPGTLRFFESKINEGFDRLRDGARNLIQAASERFGFMATDRAQRMIRDVKRNLEWAWHGDHIRPLWSIKDLQNASPIMRRYVMADPFVLSRYRSGQLAGYDEQYKDDCPGLLGETHPDYQRVMQDMVVITDEVDENGDDVIYATQWMDDYLEDERPLTEMEQNDILQVWAVNQRFILQMGEDPTSLYGASLG